MKETHDFLTPDYFPAFHCKMGECRAACCEGWPISVSMKNYFTLLGIRCKKHLRDRLDCALHLVDHPTEEEYARFSPRWDGNCPLRMDDGRCTLHAEAGEDALPDICRLYPRGIRIQPDYECSLAGSCEAVLELFLHRKEPLTFSKRTLTFEIPPIPKRTVFFETLGRETELRIFFIRVMQNRAQTLPDRLMTLGNVLQTMDSLLRQKAEGEVDRLLQSAPAEIAYPAEPDPDALLHGLEKAEGLLSLLDERSQSIQDWGEEALAYFGSDPSEAMARYESAKVRFESRFPDWAAFFEHALVNHMFFTQFPFQDRPETLPDEWLALCAVYGMLRFLAIGHMASREEEHDLIDVSAALFRLIDHTDFDRYASRMLRRLHCSDPADVYQFIRL